MFDFHLLLAQKFTRGEPAVHFRQRPARAQGVNRTDADLGGGLFRPTHTIRITKFVLNSKNLIQASLQCLHELQIQQIAEDARDARIGGCLSFAPSVRLDLSRSTPALSPGHHSDPRRPQADRTSTTTMSPVLPSAVGKNQRTPPALGDN